MPAQLLAGSRFILAQALWAAPADRGRDRVRAVVLAEQAREVFRTGSADDQAIGEIDAFLAQDRDSP